MGRHEFLLRGAPHCMNMDMARVVRIEPGTEFRYPLSKGLWGSCHVLSVALAYGPV